MLSFFLTYIVWDPNPAVFSGFDRLRWYSLLFALGFIISQQVMVYFFKKEGQDERLVDKLTIYMVLATILGARLGHVLFYEPEKYLSNPIDILKVWEGGLASHGAAIAILFALWLYAKRTPGQSYLWVVDRIVIVTAMTGALIRVGNLMNSEIGGKDTGTDSGIVYARDAEEILESLKVPIASIEAYKPSDRDAELQGNGIVPVNFELVISKGNFSKEDLEDILAQDIKYALTRFNSSKEYLAEPVETPLNFEILERPGDYLVTVKTFGRAKYPTQIYEAASYFVIFLILLGLWVKFKSRLPDGLLLGMFLISVFGMRFVWEFFKEVQVDFEQTMQFNMGQLLSIPLVAIGIVLVVKAMTKGFKEEKN
ncbi:MAG: prolipoprotein diacylglyceryl transferase [Algoriphagus aquaeductus]|uniref:prolipoprotein diacylglyceryl transferase n=1 Tax=Algoriphagus aquaeductus TaxID=475299 RepID=UPI00391CC8B0